MKCQITRTIQNRKFIPNETKTLINKSTTKKRIIFIKKIVLGGGGGGGGLTQHYKYSYK